MLLLFFNPRMVRPICSPLTWRTISILRAMRHWNQRVPILAVRLKRIGSGGRVASQRVFPRGYWLKVRRIHTSRFPAKVVKLVTTGDWANHDFICPPMSHRRDLAIWTHVPSGSIPGVIETALPYPAVFCLVNKLPKCVVSPVRKTASEAVALIVLFATNLRSSGSSLALASRNSAGIIREHRESSLMVSCGRARQRRCRFPLYMTSNEYGA